MNSIKIEDWVLSPYEVTALNKLCLDLNIKSSEEAKGMVRSVDSVRHKFFKFLYECFSGNLLVSNLSFEDSGVEPVYDSKYPFSSFPSLNCLEIYHNDMSKLEFPIISELFDRDINPVSTKKAKVDKDEKEFKSISGWSKKDTASNYYVDYSSITDGEHFQTYFMAFMRQFLYIRLKFMLGEEIAKWWVNLFPLIDEMYKNNKFSDPADFAKVVIASRNFNLPDRCFKLSFSGLVSIQFPQEIEVLDSIGFDFKDYVKSFFKLDKLFSEMLWYYRDVSATEDFNPEDPDFDSLDWFDNLAKYSKLTRYDFPKNFKLDSTSIGLYFEAANEFPEAQIITRFKLNKSSWFEFIINFYCFILSELSDKINKPEFFELVEKEIAFISRLLFNDTAIPELFFQWSEFLLLRYSYQEEPYGFVYSKIFDRKCKEKEDEVNLYACSMDHILIYQILIFFKFLKINKITFNK